MLLYNMPNLKEECLVRILFFFYMVNTELKPFIFLKHINVYNFYNNPQRAPLKPSWFTYPQSQHKKFKNNEKIHSVQGCAEEKISFSTLGAITPNKA